MNKPPDSAHDEWAPCLLPLSWDGFLCFLREPSTILSPGPQNKSIINALLLCMSWCVYVYVRVCMFM